MRGDAYATPSRNDHRPEKGGGRVHILKKADTYRKEKGKAQPPNRKWQLRQGMTSPKKMTIWRVEFLCIREKYLQYKEIRSS